MRHYPELRANRPDWSVIPRTLAGLDEQELNQTGLDEKQKKEKLESIVNSYIEAINLGQRDSAIVRHVVELLFAHGKANEALALFNRIPVESQLAGDLGRKVAQVAIDHRDFERAEEIGAKRWPPTQVVSRTGCGLSKSCRHADIKRRPRKNSGMPLSFPRTTRIDGSPWSGGTCVSTKQPEKAEQAIQEAEKNLPQAKAPMALAQCCELMAQAYEAANNEAAKVKWYGEAEKWYEKDRAAQPDDLPVTRRSHGFLHPDQAVGKGQLAFECDSEEWQRQEQRHDRLGQTHACFDPCVRNRSQAVERGPDSR